MAKENHDWGHRQIQCAYLISVMKSEEARSATFWNGTALSQRRIENAKPPGKEFLTQHWQLIVAADFFTGGMDSKRTKTVCRAVLHRSLVSKSRGRWNRSKSQWFLDEPGCRNITDADGGIVAGKQYLIHDRDPLFTAEFVSTLADAGVSSIKLPARSPNLLAHAEQFVRSIKESCLEGVIHFGRGLLNYYYREAA